MLLQLNLTEIVRTRAGKKGKWIPGFLLHGLERIIRQEGLNELLRVAHPAEGSAFSTKILDHLDIAVELSGEIPQGSAPLMFASNHPLGGLDGIALVRVLGEALGDDNIRVLVNDLLMNVTPLAGVFLPTNKYGAGGARESSRLLKEAMERKKNIVMFPAGLVSRLNSKRIESPDAPVVKDLEWKKSFVTKALEFGYHIVPVRFEAMNSMRFYRTAKWRKKLGLKVNIEQALLPGEIFKSRGKTFRISFLPAVDPAQMAAGGMKPAEIAREIYDMVYTEFGHTGKND